MGNKLKEAEERVARDRVSGGKLKPDFYIIEDKKDIPTYEFAAYDTRQYDDDIEVVKLTPLVQAAPAVLEALEAITLHLTELNSDGKLPDDSRLNTLIRDCFDLTERIKGGNDE